MKQLALIIIVSIGLSGCAATGPEWAGSGNVNTYGYKSYDPCIRCGEGWTFLPNQTTFGDVRTDPAELR